MKLTGSQRTFLRGKAHKLKPYVHLGKEGLTEALVKQIDQALNDHELIKIKFVEYKEDRKEIAADIEKETKSNCVGMVGHVGIFYKKHPNPEKRDKSLIK
ncbi:ribosome assembly RNA-binding protein YhbY [bacterium]|nr:ribosome assembly RNA-binding protein YhbY [bacterium]